MTPTTYGRDFAYCLKSHGGVRGFNASLWRFLLRCTLFCHSVATFLTSVSSYEGGCGFEVYEKSVGRNATLIIGLTPDPDGLLPAGDEQRLKEWGEEINRRFGTPLAETQGRRQRLTLNLNEKQPVNYCIIQEDIAKGERIRQYKIEAKVNGKWQTVCSGESVGHKRIAHFEPVETTALRLTVTQSVALPEIRHFSAYNVTLK